MVNNQVIFHLAIPINDLAKAKEFYSQGLGCQIGRENSSAIIFNFYGHQVVAHMSLEPLQPQKSIYPRHFGLIFSTESEWENLLEKARHQQLNLAQSPKLRFPGELIEHRTFFLEDPFYNLIELKYYRHPEAIFGSYEYTQIGDRG